jgi:predicted ferric reductase
LLQVSIVVVVVVVAVVVAGLAVALAVPCVHHLMVSEKGKNEIPRNPTICTRDMGKKFCHFIYLNIDEVVDKVPKHPMTLTNTHKHKHQSSDKQ